MSSWAAISHSREKIGSCCAIGAVAYSLEISADRVVDLLPWTIRYDVAKTSNAARSKTKAIRDVIEVFKENGF